MADDTFPDHDGDGIPDPFDDDFDGGFDDVTLDTEVATGWSVEDVAAQVAALPAVSAVKATRPPGWLALLFLGTITLVAVVAIAGSVALPVLFEGLAEPNSDALNGLESLALLGIGAISAVLGSKG